MEGLEGGGIQRVNHVVVVVVFMGVPSVTGSKVQARKGIDLKGCGSPVEANHQGRLHMEGDGCGRIRECYGLGAWDHVGTKVVAGSGINDEALGAHLAFREERRAGTFVLDCLVSNGEVFDTVGIADYGTSGTHTTAGFTGVFFIETDDVDRPVGVVL